MKDTPVNQHFNQLTMTSEWISSIELGQFKIGLRYQQTNGWNTIWFEDNMEDISPPTNFSNILKNIPHQAGLILETKVDPGCSVIYAYFGEIWKEFDSEYSIELYKDISYSGNNVVWMSNENNNSSNNFSSFIGSYWGVANLQFSLMTQNKEIIFESTEKAFSRVIKAGFDLWRESVYKHIFSNLTQLGEKVDLTAPTYKFGSLLERQLPKYEDSNVSDILGIYFRIETYLKEYRKAVLLILSRPASRILEDIKYVDLNSGQLADFYKKTPNYKFQHIEKLILTARGPLPSAFVALVQYVSYDIAENRFIVTSINFITRYLSVIIKSISKYILKKESQLVTLLMHRTPQSSPSIHLQNLEKQISQHKNVNTSLINLSEELLRRASKFREVYNISTIDELLHESEITYYDHRYGMLSTLHHSIVSELTTNVYNPKKIPFQVAPFNELYQYWSLKIVAKTLTNNTIGFVIDRWGEKDALYNKPHDNSIYCELSHPQFPSLKLELWYEKIYPKYTERHNNGATFGQLDDPRRWNTSNYSRKDRPDISLEFWHPNFHNGQFPLILTLDPTINKGSQRALVKKYGYLESIRCFDRSFDDNRNRAMKIVMASWSIFPGNSNQHLNIEPRGNTNYINLEYSKGNIFLTPHNVNQFDISLKEIIQNTIFHKLGIELL